MTGAKAGLFCKSFKPDFDHLQVLLDSFERHNPENLVLTMSVPSADIATFQDRFGRTRNNVSLVSDESYVEDNLERYRGWHAQQICKLMSFNATDADHYAVVDSDCYLTRDLRSVDLLPQNGLKYIVCGSKLRTVISQDNPELLDYLTNKTNMVTHIYPPKERGPMKNQISTFRHMKDIDLDSPSALERSDIPFKVFGAKDWFYYQPGQIFSSSILIKMRDFFRSNELSLGDIILISPWEYNWYGEFVAATSSHDTDHRISPFLHFQNKESLATARYHHITSEMITKKFLFVAMAARHLGDLRYEA